jgi:hypothetical protein
MSKDLKLFRKAVLLVCGNGSVVMAAAMLTWYQWPVDLMKTMVLYIP